MRYRRRRNRVAIGAFGALVMPACLASPAMAAGPPTVAENNSAACMTAVFVLVSLLLVAALAAYFLRHRGNAFGPFEAHPEVNQPFMAMAITVGGLAIAGFGLVALITNTMAETRSDEPSNSRLILQISPIYNTHWGQGLSQDDNTTAAPDMPAVSTGQLSRGDEAIKGAVLELRGSAPDSEVRRVETGEDGSFPIPLENGSEDLGLVRLVELPNESGLEHPVLISDRLRDATEQHPRIVAADAMKALGPQRPDEGARRAQSRDQRLEIDMVPRLQLIWPPAGKDPGGTLADPQRSRIRWEGHPDAAVYVVHFHEHPHREHGLVGTDMAYVVKGETSLPLSELSGTTATVGFREGLRGTIDKHTLYQVRVVAFDSRGRIVSRTASRAAREARFRLPAVKLEQPQTDETSAMKTEKTWVGSIVRTMKQKRDLRIASYLGTIGRPRDAMHFIERMETRRAEGTIHTRGFGFGGQDQVERLKQEVCCANDTEGD